MKLLFTAEAALLALKACFYIFRREMPGFNCKTLISQQNFENSLFFCSVAIKISLTGLLDIYDEHWDLGHGRSGDMPK